MMSFSRRRTRSLRPRAERSAARRHAHSMRAVDCGMGLHGPSWQVARLVLAGILPRLRRTRRQSASGPMPLWWWAPAGRYGLGLMASGCSAAASILATGHLAGRRPPVLPPELEPRFRSRPRLPYQAEPFVLIANHRATLMAAVLSALGPRGLAFVAKQELAEQALVRAVPAPPGRPCSSAGPIRREVLPIRCRRWNAVRAA